MSIWLLVRLATALSLSALALLAAPAETGRRGVPAAVLDKILRASPAAPEDPFNSEELLVLAATGDAPANDNFAGAIPVSLPPGDSPGGPFLGDNVNATKEPGEPNHGGNPGGHSVWWKWIAVEHARISAYSVNSDFDTVLGVYTGGAISSLTIAPPNNFTVPQPESYFFDAVAGTTYYFAVDGVDGRTGNITLNLGKIAAMPPVITGQPMDVTVTAGRHFLPLFQVTATGTGPLRYQWFHNNVPIDLANSAALLLIQVGTAQTGRYHVVVSNNFGTVASNPATLSLTADSAPVITTQPSDVSIVDGEMAHFTVVATSPVPFTYQWMFNGAPVIGATGPNMYVPNARTASAGLYSVTITSTGGSVTSRSAELRILPPPGKPTITSHPTSQTVNAGTDIKFSVTATGNPDVSYQWLRNGSPIAQATGATLSLNSVQAAQAGSYNVNVINSFGTTTSNTATLTVNAVGVSPPPAGSGGGGGGAPSWWFFISLAVLAALGARRKI